MANTIKVKTGTSTPTYNNLALGELGFNTSTNGLYVGKGGTTAPVLIRAGNAATLTTARTLKIGDTGKTFNGSANVTWTLAEIGAAAASHSHGAGDITSGTLAIGRIPTGTTGSTVALGNHGHSPSDLNINSIQKWINTSGHTYYVNITGDANTYYPVVISFPTEKEMPTFVSVWKNLGSTTNSSYSGNHQNGTSSMWLLYEGRFTGWDGNGGFIKTWYYSMPYASLCSRTEIGTGAFGGLIVYLRGGGTLYQVSATASVDVNVYYASTNISGNANYPQTVAPVTTLGNLGIKSNVALGHGDWSGNASTASALSSARTLTIGSTGKTFNGSANVSWTLAEIGAAAASHSHGAGDITSGTLAIGRIPTGTTGSTVALGNHGHTAITIRSTITLSNNGTTTFTDSRGCNMYIVYAEDSTTSAWIPVVVTNVDLGAKMTHRTYTDCYPFILSRSGTTLTLKREGTSSVKYSVASVGV